MKPSMLNELPQELALWQKKQGAGPGMRGGESLFRRYQFKDFAEAMSFMRQAEASIEQQNHHPCWQNTYNQLDVWLTTHDANNQVTEKDFLLAKALESLWQNKFK